MKRSTSVLGAVLALALAAQPAWAQTPSENQSTTDSAVAGQVGSIDVAAPVRIASDCGDDGASSNASGGAQDTGDSTGAPGGRAVGERPRARAQRRR